MKAAAASFTKQFHPLLS